MNNQSIEQDRLAREQALNTRQSFIVQAPAGSGKTELLIQRYLILLNTVDAPEEILAITFTKKAANEMRARVLKALKQAKYEQEPASSHGKKTWMLASNVLERDKKLNWQIIENPNQLRIQTIDSLCTYLTKQLPLLSHFGAQPELADMPTFLYQSAVQEVLSHVEENLLWSPAIENLLTHLDNNLDNLHKLLISLLAKRDQWLPYLHLEADENVLREQLEQHLENIITEKIQTVRDLFPSFIVSDLISTARFAANNLIHMNIDSPIRACHDLIHLPEANNQIAWKGILELLLTKSEQTWRKRFTKNEGFPALSEYKNKEEKALRNDMLERLQQTIASLHDNETIRLALVELFHLPTKHYSDDQWKILHSLLTILKILAAQLRITFQQHKKIDFIENAQAALLALGSDESPTDLALTLDYKIKHILVDEFQDTSYTQYHLLKKLITGWEQNDGKTLFVVGDPMQSIYRFREAEVGLFIRMREKGIGNLHLTPLTLSVNFRSVSGIVTWNNNTFSKLFPRMNDMINGAVTYSKSVTTLDHEEKHCVHIKGFIEADQEQENDIISLIQKQRENFPEEKIAILVRARNHLNAIIPALKKANINYRAIDIDPLAERQVIIDLLSLTFALLHPHDRVAWLAMLRAPWCGLTLADLHSIANSAKHSTLLQQLERKEIISQLSEDGKSRIAKIYPTIKTKMAERERYNLRYWVESTWILLGGPACLDSLADYQDAQVYFQLLDELSKNVETLTREKFQKRIEKLYANASHDNDSVQIMTIHTAKGLEFDTVIVPHIEKGPSNNDKSLLLWLEQPLNNNQAALMLATIHAASDDKNIVYNYIERQHKIKYEHEIDRLLYVAATRAKKNLYLLFNAHQKEDGDLSTNPGSFLHKLWPTIKHQPNVHLTITPIQENHELKKQQRLLKRFSANWENPIKLNYLEKNTFHQQQEGFQLHHHTPQLLGTMIHKILQLISINSADWWLQKSLQQRKDFLRKHFIQLGMLPQKIAKNAELTINIINNTLSDERGRWILHNHHDAKSEFAISALIDNSVKKLVIDRTFIDEQGICWIIDYKTTAFTSDEMENVLAQHQKKYLEKMQTYAKAVRLRVPNPIKLGLYFPALSAWREWEFIEQLNKSCA